MLNEIRDNEGAHKSRIRVGRGIGCSKGKTCGRGGKGQTARTGVRIKGFEGGQMPIHRRLPKRGFNQYKSIQYNVINVSDLQEAIESGKLNADKPITVTTLVEAGIVRDNKYGIKLLGAGKIKSKLTIELNKASKSAIDSVEKMGGQITLVSHFT